ncbi:MAG: hypothetical protein DI626_00240 [Micavibrio aeruginosavorus]|uniref:Uncharacterized protein n=1 Tax=Micavibrio aeruginosavorus TaxID=349221 RepID=A0A2W5A363_9BACT|nr:MAG: hypothetical protein DI626_00240 [Micavibrio aeruginosavorus]
MTTKKISELPAANVLEGSEVLPVVQDNATRKTTVTALRSGLAATIHTHTLAQIADAGTAAGADTDDFATAAQGAKADSALQHDDMGSAAFEDAGAFATAAQGAKADTALQPAAAAGFATAAQGVKADNAVQPDDLAYPGLVNAIINGGCMISQRGQKSLSNSWQYGPVDLLAVAAQGTVSAGVIKHMSGVYSLSQTGFACFVENATLGAGGAVLFRHRIEAKNAWAFYNKAAWFTARTYHDLSPSADYIITVRTPTSADNFASLTEIETDTITIEDDDNTDIALFIPDMGDCRNGIEIEIKIACGAITTKDFYVADLQLSIGEEKQPFDLRPLSLEERLVHRYLRPVVGIVGVANSGSNMQAVLHHPGMRIAPVYEVNAPIAMTDGYTADFTQSQGNIENIHENTPHYGRVDIAYFSGLTSGRFHIQRAAGGLILASAEL